MTGIFKYVIPFIILFSYSFGAHCQDLDLYVKQNFNDEYIKELSKKFETQSLLQRFLEGYSYDDYMKGYIVAGYDSIVSDTSSHVLKAYYTRGVKYTWNNLRIKGLTQNRKISEKDFSQSRPVNIGKLQKAYNDILNSNANSGYPFATVKLDSLEVTDDGKINGIIEVDEGKLYRFDSIIVKGDAKIKPYYIQKYLGIKQGDVFSLSKANDISRKIKNLSFLSESRKFELAFADSIADVILYLQNRRASSFSGLIGILPNNQTTGKLLITGDVNLYLLNSLGFGELLAVNWQKFESLSQTLQTEISFPYLFKTDFGLAAEFDIEKKDSSYLNTDFTGKILYGSNVGTGFDVYYRNTSSFILSKASEAVNSNLSNNSVNLFGLSYRFSNLDNIFNPRSGIILNATSAFGTKSYELEIEGQKVKQDPVFQNRSRIDISGFIPIGSNMTIKARNLTSVIYSKVVFNNELDLIGGLNTIRGFDERSVPATSYSIVNLEYRYLFEESSGLFAFFDAAYFEKRFTSEDNRNYGMGIGVGIDLKTPAGIFSLVFALGKQNDNPFQFNNSKIHFGYKNYF